MSYNFELSRFLDKLREEKKISYEDYLKYRGMADTLEMENQRLRKENLKERKDKQNDKKWLPTKGSSAVPPKTVVVIKHEQEDKRG